MGKGKLRQIIYGFGSEIIFRNGGRLVNIYTKRVHLWIVDGILGPAGSSTVIGIMVVCELNNIVVQETCG